jgi:uncharacterized protein YgfB (UPF0149 family)
MEVKVLVDSLGDYEDMPDWSESADVLFDAGLTLNPSELHGAIAGMLGAGKSLGSAEDSDRALMLLEKALGVDLQGAVADFAGRLIAATRSAVADADFAFTPLLPDDDDPIDQRLASMGRWVSGFLAGFTQAVSVGGGAADAIQPHTAEALKDFAAIAHVDASQDEDEQADRELEELIEYVRIAALNIVHDALDNE